MNRIKSILLFGILFFFIAIPYVAGQEITDPMVRLKENPFSAGVNTCPYQGGPYADTPAPKGYKPFYISHYGRHGSRTNWDEWSYKSLIATLEKAEAESLLTTDGKILLEVTCQCLELQNGMAGRLTPRGVREHRGIAERMYKRFKAVLRSGEIRCVSSTVPRCLVSMAGFTNRLSELNPRLDISMDSGEAYMNYIDPKVPSEYTRDATRSIFSLKRLPLDTLKYVSAFFSDATKGMDIIGNFSRFEQDVFAVARITPAFDIPTDIFPMIPEESIYNNWLSNNAYLYLGHANTPQNGYLRLAPAHATVDEMVDKADAVIAGEKVAADLRFGHDFPFTAMCCYIGFEGVGETLTTEEIAQKWFGADYTPFAANLQWIFYRGRSGDVIVKFLLNEREILIKGLEPVQGPYYRWEAIKAWLKERDAVFQQAVASFEAAKK